MTMQITILHTAMATKCPACLDHLASGPTVTQCSTCAAYHHAECLEELGCSSLVCTATGAEGYTQGATALTGDFGEHPNPLAVATTESYYSCNYNETHQEWQLPYVSSGPYNDLMAQVNYATLAAEFGGDPCHCDLIGQECNGHPDDESTACAFWNAGSFQVLEHPCHCPRGTEDPWSCEQAAVEAMDSLENYPVLDDCLHSEAECHDEDEQWSDYARQEFLGALEQATDLEADNVTDEQADDLRSEATDETGQYPERSGEDVCFPLDVWVEHLADDKDHLREHGFMDPEPVVLDYPLSSRQTLSPGNIIYSERAVEILPPGRPDTPDTRRMIVRRVRSQISKVNRRSHDQRDYRRLAYRVALEYYLGRV